MGIDRGCVMLIEFDNPIAFIDDAHPLADAWQDNDEFYGNETADETRATVYAGGDDSLVPLAQSFLNQIEASIDSPQRELLAAPFGGFCVVPEAMQGYPLAMRRMQRTESDGHPLRVSVCVTSSAGVDCETLARRGAAILSLCMALESVRPISLQIHCELSGADETRTTLVTCKIPTAPLSLAQACHLLTHQSIHRRAMFDLATKYNRSWHQWPRGFVGGSATDADTPYRIGIRDQLGFTADDLVIPPVYLTDQLVRDPVAWINAMVAKYGE